MRRFIFLIIISVLLIKNATPSKYQSYPSRLAWLFGLNSKPNENKENTEESNEGDKPTVCKSQECKKIAQIFSESMDKSVDPCDDFYEYACGKWPEHNPIPEGMNSWNMYILGTRLVMKKTREIFDEGPKDDDLLAIKLAKKWYAVCMNTDAMDRQGLEPLVFTLSRIGGWPMIMEPDEWNEQEYSWQKVDDQYMRLMGTNAFHDVRVIERKRSNESEKKVHIDTPHLPSDSYSLWSGETDFSKEDESDEDLSDEEEQSDEQGDSQEPGSEGEDHDKSDNKSNNNDDNDDNDSNDVDNDGNKDDNDDNETNEQDNDNENLKKKVGMRKTGKFAKKEKVRDNKKIKTSIHSKKHKNHRTKKERVKRRVIPINIHKKLRSQKNERIHMKRVHRQKLKETLQTTTPQISTEETTDEDKKKKQVDYISKVARAIAKARGVDVTEKHMNRDIQDMIDFQIKLTDITMDLSDEKDMTLNEFQEWYDKKKPKTVNSKIDWVYKIREIFDEAYVPVKDDLNLTIKSPGYFKNLIALLDETSSRTIVNYIHWNFLSKVIRTTTSEMRKLYNTRHGYDENDNEENDNEDAFGFSGRSRRCIREIDMGNLLAYEYVRNQFPDKVKTTAADMMDDIQKEVEYQIKESDWLDEDTKDFVLEKLVNMKKFIGYPDWYRNDTIVKRYFQGLIIINSYYENTLSYNRYSKWKELRKLMKNNTNDGIMVMSPLMVNAMFSESENSIDLPAANFQNPFFAYGRPQAINYGIVGSTMAHEVSHGFDDTGHLYNKNGEEVEWLSAMAEGYSKRAECFVEQFNNYPIDKESNYTIKDYGNQTISENIADTMGLEATFRAYRRRERECENPGTVLPGLEDLTNDQLFFLSFAYLSCEAQSNSALEMAKADSHSIERLRVIGSVSNSQDFAKAYNCPVGSAMNPERKCNIWK
ncbi:endothelin-converting enzyme 1 [Solenopsis invicta]|uniref:endothelin-converting enzyme 1 n=1 Tax=Solenopsis invicta TaxID=13686 RepID=UPI00193D11CE|nr:endothelin-converting enzyme 1 [Solenopsis invicta]